MDKKISKASNWELFTLFLVYFVINFSFLVKYGVRQSVISIYILMPIFILFHIGIYKWGIPLISRWVKNPYMIKGWVIAIAIIYLGLTHVLNDPYKLKIDRWQTIEYTMRYWLDGKYIYDTRNYMGNFPSYLPGQLLIILPFYFLGNVGYLQVAAFILFGYAVSKEFKNQNIKFLAIFLLSISLSYVYELVCKSDLISSFILVSAFILYWHRKFQEDYFKKPFLLGLVLGGICLTRSVVVIPLILFLLKPFLETNFKNKIKVCIGFVITFSILLFTVLAPAKDFDYILKYNPLQLQGQANKYVTLFFLVMTVVLAFFVKSFKQVFFLSTLIIWGVMASFIIETILRGFTLEYMSFSYWASALPFCIIAYCYEMQEQLYSDDE
ncbi:hypothetical protein D1631_14730 [Chryseobacterium nematophagum]|uniref:Glycosyltransferase RgtA/B/C/D-like domain-containing protein n=1 Tax=Chryseobacterium nematophagum TaxID=2305228 RepID=A0A3M7TJK6_9FLAO|nr:hypothetical protein [Chryseobacterium nematophagum]RNA63097.1 hypothetical protein D1631_14730 [Chryseobacterium nematophagum]